MAVPKLWSQTVAAHRQSVREAILDTTWRLVIERGLLSVTMSQIAEQTGIARATLYGYYPDVQAILVAWHQRHLAGHLAQLAELAARPGPPGQRLAAVLEAYALICFHRDRHEPELAALLHRPGHVSGAQQQLRDLLRGLLAEAAAAGELRDDVATGELAGYCLHALAAAGGLPSRAAVRRLVRVTLDGLHPPS